MRQQGRCDPCDTPLPDPWDAAIPLWRSSLVVRQVFVVLTIAIGMVWLFMIILTAAEGDLDAATLWSISRIFLIILGGLLLGAFLVMAVLYRRYEYRFTLDEQGVLASTTGRTRKKNALINALLVLSGRPSAMGAGMLAGSRQDQRVRWKDATAFRVDTRRRQITLRRGRRTLMLIQCTDENLETVRRVFDERVAAGTR